MSSLKNVYILQTVDFFGQILSDEKLRDVYNRFGENVSTDPRLDDFSLIMSLFTDALYWALIAYVITIPRGSQGCRTWMILSLMGVSAGSFAFQLSGVDIPNFEFMGLNFLSCVTEHDVLITSHRLVPFILMLLVAVSEYYYINTEILAAEVLENFIISQKVLYYNIYIVIPRS